MARKVALVALMAAGSIAMWIAIPLGWLWLASKIAGSSDPSLGPYALVLVGIPVSMFAVGKGLGALNRAYGRVDGTAPHVRVPLPWHRSMRGERDAGRPRTVLDVVMVCSVSVALAAFAIWFFGFAGSSLG